MIEKTKGALKTLLTVGSKVVNAAEDGKITAGEAIGIGLSAIGLIGVFKDLKAIGAELATVKKSDIDDLVAEFTADFEIDNDALESKIEAGIVALSEMVKMLVPA
jgi:hypothetical protein